MNKKFLKLILCVFLGQYMFPQSQEALNTKDLKYCKHYFLAEKHKVLDEHQDALREYENCIAQNPKISSSFFEAAKIYFGMRNYKQAERYMLKARSLEPKNIWYAYLLIDIYYQQFELKKQALVWEELIKSDPDNQFYYFECISVYIQLKNYTKAFKILQKAENKVKINESLVILRAEIFLKKDQIDKAIQALLLAHEQFPANLIFLEKLSDIYIKKSDYKLASEVYEKILQIDPFNSLALLASYTIFSSQNLIEKEKKAFSQILKSTQVSVEQKRELLFEIFSNTKKIEMYKESFPEALSNCIQAHPEETIFYILLGDYHLLHNEREKALKYYINAINHTKQEKLLYERILNIYFSTNELNQVINYSNKAIEYFPIEPIFYYYKGLAFFYKKEHQKTLTPIIKGLDYVIEDNQLSSEMYAILGDAYHALGEHKSSDQSYELALENNPEYVIVLNNYSYYLSLRGENLLKAEKMIIKCLDLTKNNPEPSFLDTYAWVLFKQGEQEVELNLKKEKYIQSKKTMEACIEHGGNSAVIFEHYGDVLFKLDEIESAIEQWNKALKIDNTNIYLKEKIERVN